MAIEQKRMRPVFGPCAVNVKAQSRDATVAITAIVSRRRSS
ncbi:hypothetical protein AKJ09_01010 [Labilithrix luteola]|uniref:Uncharacterized protein n=1 Tax=Labilithrix luteola TaxID=1391654 RepID=A0A0K1PLS8_9BACT|nr:hypothetical protein AKJ09_01010 [Labilithrix luteola]